MKTRPTISDEEIRQLMDFDKLLKQHQVAHTNRPYLKPLIALGVLVVALTGWYMWQSDAEVPLVDTTNPPTHTPMIVDSSEVKAAPATVEISKEQVPPQTKPQKPVATVQEKSGKEPAEEADVYTEAEPIGGYPDLYDYFQKELRYPTEALRDSVEGIVSVSFIIDGEGKPDQIKVLSSPGPAFDDEAIRIINTMPRWNPATLNGKSVPAKISMPLTFQISKSKKQ